MSCGIGERWCSELIGEPSLYPVRLYYRSRHDRPSWLPALLTIVLQIVSAL